VRAQVVGDAQPRVSGHTTFRSVIPTEQMPEDLRWNAATLWAGPKCHIVHYPLKGGKVFNLVVTCHNDAPEAVAGVPVSRDVVYRGFEHIAARPKQIIERGENWKLWVLCDRDPVDNWVDGRVVLLGDAAHPMLQYLAQGACMALEDAVNLSHHMAEADGNIEAAFPAYNHARFTRTGRVQINSRLMGEFVYHPAGGQAALRNAILGSSTREQHYDRIAWLYGVTGLGTAT
jgi:salicylate hydroxylase